MATKRWLYTLAAAYVVGMVLFALTIAPADASHPISMCLDIEPDRDGVTVGADSTLQALLGISDSDHPPDTECHFEAFEAGTDTQIDFEITGAGDEDGATPSTPDLSCEVQAGSNSCSIEPPSSGNGDQQIQAWIDQDRDDGTVELDTTEGWDEESTPGEVAEPDGTDVAFWTWTKDYDPPAPRTIRHTTVLSISYDRQTGRFRGQASSERLGCRWRRLIRLRKARPGADRIIDAAITRRDGSWVFVPEKRLRGRISAKAARKIFTGRRGNKHVCQSDESRWIRVR